MPLIYFLIFCLIALLELYAEATLNTGLRYFAKPMIMISLISFFCLQVNKKEKLFYIFLAAFVFALLGDVFLMFQLISPTFFLLGLASFLITHLLYIAGINMQSFLHFNVRRLIGIFAVLIASVIIMVIIWPGLGEMTVPVVIYVLAIVSMMISAIINNSQNSRASYVMILIGAGLFMASDSMIAINKFAGGLAYANLLIMATYISAQFYIFNGAVLKINSVNPEGNN